MAKAKRITPTKRRNLKETEISAALLDGIACRWESAKSPALKHHQGVPAGK